MIKISPHRSPSWQKQNLHTVKLLAEYVLISSTPKDFQTVYEGEI